MSSVAVASDRQEDLFWSGRPVSDQGPAREHRGALGLVEASLPRGFGPPLHIHRREDETFYVIEGEIGFRQGQEEFVGGPGSWVWGPRGVPHTFKVESESARALIVATPGGFERMFEVGGVPVSESPHPPVLEYDPDAAVAMSQQFEFEVVGPQLA